MASIRVRNWTTRLGETRRGYEVSWYDEQGKRRRKLFVGTGARSAAADLRDRLERHGDRAVQPTREPLSLQEIVGRSKPVGDIVVRGIYFLISEDKVLYVGQSENICKRIAQHLAAGIVFDRVSMLRWDGDLDALERAYILAFRPPLNACALSKNLKRAIEAAA